MNRRQEAKQRTAALVLAKAREIFATKGYEAATIREIAKAAGMSTGAVFANYRDKAELYTVAFGHPPIAPDVGRCLAIALGRIVQAAERERPQGMDPEWRHAIDALELAKFGRECWVPMPDPGTTT